MTVEDLRKWYETWYAPNNAILVVVGDVKPNLVYQLAQTYFSNLKSITLPKIKPEKDLPPLGEKRLIIHTPAQLPWLVIGDFNEIKCQSEKEGGAVRSAQQMQKFVDTINWCSLRDLGFVGPKFTWLY